MGAGVCAVPTADVVATGEVNCYNYIALLCTMISYTEMRPTVLMDNVSFERLVVIHYCFAEIVCSLTVFSCAI